MPGLGTRNWSTITSTIAAWYADQAEVYTTKNWDKGGPYATTQADRDAIVRRAGLLGDYAGLVAAADLAGVVVPGRTKGDPSKGFSEWQADGEKATLILRAWAARYLPALINPAASQPPWAEVFGYW